MRIDRQEYEGLRYGCWLSRGCSPSNSKGAEWSVRLSCGDEEGAWEQISLMPDADHLCVLTGYEAQAVDDWDDPATCHVFRSNNKWWLKAQVKEQSWAQCFANCWNGPLKRR